jgi:hypothetical protein
LEVTRSLRPSLPDPDHEESRLNKIAYGVAIAVGLALLAVAWYLGRPQPAETIESPPAAVAPALPAASEAAPMATAGSEPAVQHPIEVAAPDSAASAPFDVETALGDLFGRKTVLSMFQLDDFPRRVVATVDNLGRSYAPARLWPVNPVSGPFIVEEKGGGEVIGADNGLRYTPYVLLIETVDLRQAVALYRRMYPSLQQAYVDLGYPKRYFNDRLVEVIDQLLATPDITESPKVHLPAINTPVRPERPWVLYEFDDPALQSLSAGQKMLLRMGPVNERRMKAKLAEIRRLVTADAPTRQ